MTTSGIAQIRQKLDMAFDDSALSAFSLDYFPIVYDHFSQGMRKDHKITLLLDYCRRQPTGFETLLDKLRKEYTSKATSSKTSNESSQQLKLLIDALSVYIGSPLQIAGTTKDGVGSEKGTHGLRRTHTEPKVGEKLRVTTISLVETLAVKFSPTIGKHILKRWLKSDLSQELSSDLLDLLAEKTPDFFAQRQGKRQFEEIGLMVSENLLPIFEDKGRRLDEGSRTAVAEAVNDTLKQTGVTANLLEQKELSPTDLATHWHQSDSPAVNLFSELETSLYHRLLDELAIYIVDISSQLPPFTERTFVKLLKDRRELLDQVDEVLEQINRIRQAVGDPDKQAAQFEADYRLAVIRQLDELELFGVNLGKASRRYKLSLAYVSLLAEQKLPDRGHGLTLLERLVSHVTMSVHQALATSGRLLVRGRAGSGKTTLLKWVAVQMAAQKLDGPLADWNRLVPFFIRLRQVRDQLPSPEDFPSLVAPEIAATMPKQWVHQLLNAGKAVVLVDGLDQVPEAQRDNVEKWLNALVQTFAKTRFIVTSRSYMEVRWLIPLKFETAELQDMNFAEIDQFIDRWHDAVALNLQEMGRSDDMQPDLAANLKSEIRRRPALRNLAINPLLCAMLCALNWQSRGKLPTRRIKLYQASIYMLLEGRDLEQRVSQADYPHLTYTDKRALLGDLAYWMLRHGWSEVSQEEAENRFAHTMHFMPNLPSDATASKVRRLFTERSSLLRQTVKGQLRFTHRTFQEYLAAEEAIDKDDIELLIDHAQLDEWQEVMIVAVGVAPRLKAAELLTKLIERGDQEANNRHYLYLLAMASLETVERLAPTIKSKVEERVAQIVPPNNKQESRALANTGELAVPYLKFRPEYSPQIAVLCVKTLNLIGSEAALEALRSYIGDGRQEVERALLNASDSFDRQEFTQEILNSMVTQRSILDNSHHLNHSPTESASEAKVKFLTGKQVQELQKVIISAFPMRSNLRQMIRFQLDENLSQIAGGGNLTDLVFNLIQWAEASGKVEQLVRGAHQQNPGNKKLKAFADKYLTTRSERPSQADIPLQSSNYMLSFSERKQLVEYLLAIPSIADRDRRITVINELDINLKANVAYHSVDRSHVFNLVTTCLQYPNGMQKLRDILQFFEGNSIAMQRFEEALNRLLPRG